jgi:hypothetical protein
MPGASVERLRAWATELPSVTERRHARFNVPVWQVSGETFLGMGPDRTTAIFCIPEESASAAAVAHPEFAHLVYRPDSRRSYLGLEVRLRLVSGARLKLWVLEAWAAKAPKRLSQQRLDEYRVGRRRRRPQHQSSSPRRGPT